MKKFVLPLVIVLVASAGAALLLQRHSSARTVHASQLLPAKCLLFAELPDWPRTAERWRKTALYQLWQEPEVQAFLEKPRNKAPGLLEWQTHLDQFNRIGLKQAFAAVTEWNGNSPRFVAGFSYTGSRVDVEKALAEPRAQLHRLWPTGKANIVSYGDAEIQTYSDKENTVAEVFRGNWYFVASEVELLRDTLDRYDGKSAKGTIEGEAVLKKTMAPLPPDGDFTVFAHVGVLMERLSSLMAAAGQDANATQLANLKQTQAIGYSTKLDGAQCRDTVFTYAPGTAPGAPLPRRALAMSTAASLLYYAALLPASSDAPSQQGGLLSAAQLLPALAEFENTLAAKGLKFQDLPTAFGPEVSALVDWAPATLGPSLLLTLDVRNAAMAKSFVNALIAAPSGEQWEQKQQEETTIFSPPPAPPGLAALLPRPAIALSDRLLVAGLSAQSVSDALAQAKAGAGKLSDQPAFQAAEKWVQPPTAAFGYLDLQALVGRAVNVFRPMLVMSMALNPDSGQFIDAGKLPSTETLTKHLGVTVNSQSATADGVLVESAGSLTFNQAVGAILIGAGFSALPTLDATMKSGGSLLPPGLLPPGFPGAAPSATAPPPASGPVPPAGQPSSTPGGPAPVPPAENSGNRQ